VEGFAAGYGSTPIWSHADFSVNRGEFVGVLGPNGAGKTTLLRLLLGLAKPSAGTLSVLGAPPRRGNPKIGYVPQRHQIDGSMRIEALELVRLGVSAAAAASGGRTPAALAALNAVGAEALAHRPLGELSGGELQRIFLAEALAGEPELLLLDEPLANLDIRRETELVQLVADIVHTRGVAALLIAHNINPLLPVLDRVIYVANGRIAPGTPEEVLTSESLSAIYGAPIEVLRDSRGRIAVVGLEEPEHHHE
jgi:zinc/manganese transport system ATP-binding protein